MKKEKRKNKPGAGRPKEGRVRINITILPETEKRIITAMDDELDTLGKVVDDKFNPAKRKV